MTANRSSVDSGLATPAVPQKNGGGEADRHQACRVPLARIDTLLLRYYTTMCNSVIWSFP